VSPVKYEMGFYIPEDGIPHSYRHENVISYIIGGWLQFNEILSYDAYISWKELCLRSVRRKGMKSEYESDMWIQQTVISLVELRCPRLNMERRN
jgi:hypothetical protein